MGPFTITPLIAPEGDFLWKVLDIAELCVAASTSLPDVALL
jgi:hypothetical protein